MRSTAGRKIAPLGVLAATAVSLAAVPPAAVGGRGVPPAKVTGRRIAADPPSRPRPGTIVSASTLGHRTFVSGRVGFALAHLTGAAVGGGADYPAVTRDGGRSWRLDGPHLHLDAADAPDVVTVSNAASARTFYAYGGPGGGQAVDVTTDGGRHWWRTYLPAPAEAIAYSRLARRPELIAFLQGSPTWVYVSTDGGRSWRHSRSQTS